MRSNNTNTPLPANVERAIRRLGDGISLARRRRHWSQAMLAERIGASVATIKRMEEGSPGTAIQHLARALHVFGDLAKLEALLDSANDSVGLAMADQSLPKRIRTPKRTPHSGAL